ncbi:MAG: mannose-6-phosphate isomerase, class I [Micrococcales bacterium 73-13]|nr:MAG: mannose-6-phosphate isomerase, class I [Micrococcales bacterium 73-13]
MLVGISNEPRDYAWGRRGAITALLGRPATDAVEAELWLGAHHGSPARISGSEQSLRDAVPDLTFLLKVLAVGAPLSLQAHPGAEQAREGFAREELAGIPVDARHRNYRDPLPKPELLVAVSPRFEALSGFRPAAEARRDAERIAAAGDLADAVAPLTERLVDDEALGDVLVWLLAGGPEVDAIVDALGRGLAAEPSAAPHLARIAELHPADPGIAAALLLHHLELRAGEALYLPAGNVHAYLDGVGVELMRASDNVLRGGLTPKHVDAAELGRIVQRAAVPLPRLEPVALPDGGLLYEPSDPEAGFSLAVADRALALPLAGPAIALCTDGAFLLEGERSATRVVRGEAVLVTADEGTLRASGAGSLYVAR